MPMHRRSAPFLLSLGALALLSCLLLSVAAARAGSTPPYDPFVVPAAKFHAEVRTMALAPLDISDDPKVFSSVRAGAEAHFAESLAKHGFRVVPSAEYARAWKEIAGRLGGVFDPLTGAPVPEKWKACSDLVARELARLHGIHAIAYSSLNYSPLRWGSEGFSGNAVTLGEPVLLRGKGVPAMGYEGVNGVLGSWFGVVVRDLAGADMFNVQSPVRWERVYVARAWGDRPDHATPDLGRIQAAIDRVAADLAPPASHSKPAEGASTAPVEASPSTPTATPPPAAP